MLDDLRPGGILTSLEPDLPLFVAGSGNYETIYTKFVREGASDIRFLIKPNPHVPEQVALSGERLDQVVNRLNQGAYQCGTTLVGEVVPQSKEMQVNSLLTPLLWAHQHQGFSGSVLACGFPYLLWLDLTARVLPYGEFRRLLASLGPPGAALLKFQKAVEQNFGGVNAVRALYMAELAVAASNTYEKSVFVIGAFNRELAR